MTINEPGARAPTPQQQKANEDEVIRVFTPKLDDEDEEKSTQTQQEDDSNNGDY